MQSYENKGAEVYTNGSARHMNGTELTKIKEVAFEKNPSEPMVQPASTHTRTHTYAQTHTHTFSVFQYVLLIPPHRLLVSLSVGGHSEAERQTKVHCGQNTAWGHDPQTR